MLAVRKGREGCLRLLIAAGVDLEHEDQVCGHSCMRIQVGGFKLFVCNVSV